MSRVRFSGRSVLLTSVIALLASAGAFLVAPGASALCPPDSDTCGGYVPPPPPALSGLHVVSTTRTSVTIAWNDLMTDESGYQVTMSGHNTYTAPGTHGASVPVSTIQLPAHTGTGVYTWTASSLTPAWTWTFWVSAERDDQTGTSQNVTAQTLGDPPPAPSVSQCPGPSGSVYVCWTNPTPSGYQLPPDYFRIDRAPAGSSTWTTVGTAAAGAPGYVDGSPPYGTNECWRVAAFDNGGSTMSNSVCLTVPGAAPKDPTNVQVSGYNGRVSATWSGDASAQNYDFTVTDGGTTYHRTVTGGTSGTFGTAVDGIGCGHQVSTSLQAQTSGDYPGTVIRSSLTMACATAPDVTDLTGTVNGTTITWTWIGSAADTNYSVTVTDVSDLQPWTTDTVAGGHNGVITYPISNLIAGHTYHLLVVTHRTGNYDSPGAGASAITTAATSGVKEVDVYNCSAAGNRTLWLSTGGAWTNEGVAPDVGSGVPCGPGASQPLKITLPTGYVTLDATDDGQQPNGTDNVKYQQTFTGSDSGGIVPAILTTS